MSALSAMSADERDQVYGAVIARYPDLEGEALRAKAERVAAIMAHSSDGPRWTS